MVKIKKARFLKLRMMWGILLGRTVIYNAEIEGTFTLRTKKAYVIKNEIRNSKEIILPK